MKKLQLKTDEGIFTIIVTDHSEKRCNKRLKLKGKMISKMARKSLLKGMNIENSWGEIKDFIKSKYNNYKKANAIHIYGDGVYIYEKKGDRYILLTVLELPSYYKKYWCEFSQSRSLRELRRG